MDDDGQGRVVVGCSNVTVEVGEECEGQHGHDDDTEDRDNSSHAVKCIVCNTAWRLAVRGVAVAAVAAEFPLKKKTLNKRKRYQYCSRM